MADTFTVTKSKIGAVDINFGTGTFERTLSDGSSTEAIEKINAGHIPIEDAQDLFKHTYLEDVVKELHELFTNAHIQTWYYQDDNNEILHGMGDVINQPADVTPTTSWWMKDEWGNVIHGMGDIINL